MTRLYRTVYGWTITVFFLWQGLFLYLMKNKGLGSGAADRGPEDLLTVSLSTTVYLVVAVNTIVFLIEAAGILGPRERDTIEDKKRKAEAEGSSQAFCWFLITATFLAGALALFILLGGLRVLDPRYVPWKAVLRINEVASVVIFGWFLLANLSAQRACKLILLERTRDLGGGRERIEQLYRKMKLLFMAVDFPGFLGLVFIVIVSHVLYPGHLQFSYWHGFVAGAIALHIAFSQTALALIAAQDKQSRPTRPTTVPGIRSGDGIGDDSSTTAADGSNT